jgi:hypothetical protein
MMMAATRILLTFEVVQQGEAVVNNIMTGMMQDGDSCVTQANLNGTRNPKRELLYRPTIHDIVKKKILIL